MDSYEYKLKIQRDLNAAVETAYEDGIEAGRLQAKLEGISEAQLEALLKGRLKGKLETTKKLKEFGISMGIIIKVTGLYETEIEKL